MIEIKINCKGTHYISLNELNVLQDTKDFCLKELSKVNFDKLRKRIEKKGFWFPFFVWHCKKEDKWYYTDGTQRHKVLLWMQESGQYKLPEKFPAVEIFAKDKKEAAEAILTQSTSFGKITDEGLYGFLNEYDLDLADIKDELELSNIDLDEFEKGWLNDDIENAKENDIPELQQKTKTKQGDIYQLGEHYLLCGDATKRSDIEKLMNGEKINIVFTSPPYNSKNQGMKYDYYGEKRNFYRSKNDNKSKSDYFSFCIKVLKNISLFVENTHSIFWNVIYNANSRDDYGKIIFSNENPFQVKETIIWDKGNGFPSASQGILSRVCELIFLLSMKKKYLTNQAKDEVSWNVWRITANGAQIENHNACFPVGLPEKALKDFGFKGCICFDPFLGSGSTLIACEKTNRICYGIEIDPFYTDIIIQRYVDYTNNDKVIKNGEEVIWGKLGGQE